MLILHTFEVQIRLAAIVIKFMWVSQQFMYMLRAYCEHFIGVSEHRYILCNRNATHICILDTFVEILPVEYFWLRKVLCKTHEKHEYNNLKENTHEKKYNNTYMQQQQQQQHHEGVLSQKVKLYLFKCYTYVYGRTT